MFDLNKLVILILILKLFLINFCLKSLSLFFFLYFCRPAVFFGFKNFLFFYFLPCKIKNKEKKKKQIKKKNKKKKTCTFSSFLLVQKARVRKRPV